MSKIRTEASVPGMGHREAKQGQILHGTSWSSGRRLDFIPSTKEAIAGFQAVDVTGLFTSKRTSGCCENGGL